MVDEDRGLAIGTTQADKDLELSLYKSEREQVRHHESQIRTIIFESLIVIAGLLGASLVAKEAYQLFIYNFIIASLCLMGGVATYFLQEAAGCHVERSRRVRAKLVSSDPVLAGIYGKPIGQYHAYFKWFHVAFFLILAISASLVVWIHHKS